MSARGAPRRTIPLRPKSHRLLPTLAGLVLLIGACAGDATSDRDGAAGDSDGASAAGDAATPGTTIPGTDAPATGDGTLELDRGTTVPFDEVALTLEPLVTVNQPIALAVHPDDDNLWIAERRGRIRLVERTIEQGGALERLRLRTQPLLDISDLTTTDSERGLLGMAFSPDGAHLYLHYTDRDGNNVIAAYTVETGADGIGVDAGSARQLLTVDQPFSNHNGGDLLVDPDGLLYITVGDGGGSGDPELTGQDPTDLLGSILRIDPMPAGEPPYAIPDGNPFVSDPVGAPEVWLWGARNPWRASFDPATGDLWVADVGQNEIEEINHLPASEGAGRGANLGWNLMEGNERFAGDPPHDHVPPVHTYDHDDGRCSITGGHVYRGDALPALDGVYVYGDYCSGEVFGLRPMVDGTYRSAPLDLDRRVDNVISFGQDREGEIYTLLQGGQVSRLADRNGGITIEVSSGG